MKPRRVIQPGGSDLSSSTQQEGYSSMHVGQSQHVSYVPAPSVRYYEPKRHSPQGTRLNWFKVLYRDDVFQKFLLVLIMTSLAAMIFVNVKLQASLRDLQHCKQNMVMLQHEVTAEKKELYESHTVQRDNYHEAETLHQKLASISPKLVIMDSTKAQLLKQLDKLIKKYTELKKEKHDLAQQYQLSKTQTTELSAQSKQLEDLLTHLKSALKEYKANEAGKRASVSELYAASAGDSVAGESTAVDS